MSERLLCKRLGKDAVNKLTPAEFQAEKKAERSRQALVTFDKTTLEGRARRSTQRENLMHRDATNTAVGGVKTGQIGLARQTASALDLFSLLEARVKERHRDTLPGFVAEEWLQDMKSADRATKTSLGMLTSTEFATYMALIKPTKKKLTSTRDPLEKARRQNAKTQAIYELIISTPADGDNSIPRQQSSEGFCRTSSGDMLRKRTMLGTHIQMKTDTVQLTQTERGINSHRNSPTFYLLTYPR
jgi:hypothetical protein